MEIVQAEPTTMDLGQVLCPLALQVRRVTSGLVGRPTEVETRAGRLACVVAEGEPGIGKTGVLLRRAASPPRAGSRAR